MSLAAECHPLSCDSFLAHRMNGDGGWGYDTGITGYVVQE